MAAITATGDITITVNDRNIEGKKKRNRCTITLGTGENDYPPAGIPLPTYPSWGMVRNIEYIHMYDSNATDGTVWKYSASGHALRGYIQTTTTAVALAELATTVTITGSSWQCEAVGW